MRKRSLCACERGLQMRRASFSPTFFWKISSKAFRLWAEGPKHARLSKAVLFRWVFGLSTLSGYSAAQPPLSTGSAVWCGAADRENIPGGGSTPGWPAGRGTAALRGPLSAARSFVRPRPRTGVTVGDPEGFSPGCRPCFSRLYRGASWVAGSQRPPRPPRLPSTLS